ncbi:LysR family transcriptional regulator [Paracidovorax wautersii]|uniref:DNA-binding transcriptional regulator, LysR family n=1 Tax=Paracidovorax wautersii TaxID=1177982 RepID=A0A1I2BLI3_9BURK|nr:LysR family transcriptional regulator [Paracidovorax wautersii]SFE56080.1 DNA-binding transcriptional regulator, LysR family [Paracidovorax wautersii]
MNVTLRQLHVFQAVAATRNFSRAGDAVGLTQPAVSRSITELEAQLGLKLLHRTTREVELTEAGRSLAARLPRLLDELEGMLLDVRGMGSARRSRVRVASSPTLSAHLMPECIARCREALPGVELLLLDRIQNDVLASVLSGEVDFGVVIDPSDRDALHCEPILTDPFCLACPPGHRLAAKARVRWADLAGESLVLLDHASGSRRLIDQALAAQAVPHAVAQEVGHATTIFRMLDAGLGISVIPTLAVPPEGLPRLAVRPLVPRVDREIVLARRRHRELAPMAQAVWELVGQVARQRKGLSAG